MKSQEQPDELEVRVIFEQNSQEMDVVETYVYKSTEKITELNFLICN